MENLKLPGVSREGAALILDAVADLDAVDAFIETLSADDNVTLLNLGAALEESMDSPWAYERIVDRVALALETVYWDIDALDIANGLSDVAPWSAVRSAILTLVNESRTRGIKPVSFFDWMTDDEMSEWM